jgi:small subunit ribosomal protein S6
MVTESKSEELANVDDKSLCEYEMVFIINPEVAEERVDTIIEEVSRLITGKGGIVAEMERWGKRKMAYPIRHFTEGSYVLARFKMKPASGKELEVNLRISEEILRHLLVRVDQ